MAALSSDADASAHERLYPLYLHELSRYTEHYHVDEEGRWEPYYLADWVTRAECTTLLARVDGIAAGFAWVAAQPFPHMAPDADFRLTELFVANPFRRSGVGRALAEYAFDRFHGRWTLEVVDGNEPALAFWRRLLPQAEERPGAGDVAFRFST